MRYQDSGFRAVAEAELIAWIEGPNPWLVEVALDEAATHVLAGPPWVPPLLQRTRDINPVRRRLAVRAIGEALARGRFDPEREDAEHNLEDLRRSCREAIVQLARSDEDPVVRRSAVAMLAKSGIADAELVLESIAKDDPDQDVRYEAAAALATGIHPARDRVKRRPQR